jgi:heme A synthase
MRRKAFMEDTHSEVSEHMSAVIQLHRVISNSAYLFFLLLGLWGFYRAIRKRGVDGGYMGALVIGELIFVVQAVLGIILAVGGETPGRGAFHYLYGAFAVVALPGLFAYLKGDDSNTAQWYYATAAVFLFGIALRAITTGV